jgi:hypothetical protein
MSYSSEIALNAQLDSTDRELLLDFIEELQNDMDGYDECTCEECVRQYDKRSVVVDILLAKVAQSFAKDGK